MGRSFYGVRLSLLKRLAILCVVIVAAAFFLLRLANKNPEISCVKDHKVVFSLDFPHLLTLPLVSVFPSTPIPFLDYVFEGEHWKITALCSASVGELMAELLTIHKKDLVPLVAFVQDRAYDEYLIFIEKEGKASISSLRFLSKSPQIHSVHLDSKEYLEVALPSHDKKRSFFILRH